VLLAATLADVGLDVRKDVRVVTRSPAEAVRGLTAGEVDGLLALPPFSQQLRPVASVTSSSIPWYGSWRSHDAG
jgi:ABC-type nitrate/sulfonate/bicarbonate transport system substrate-binding protein